MYIKGWKIEKIEDFEIFFFWGLNLSSSVASKYVIRIHKLNFYYIV